MTDAHFTTPSDTYRLTDEERLTLACDWSDHRKAYGCSPDPKVLKAEHQLFRAGWIAGRSAEPRKGEA